MAPGGCLQRLFHDLLGPYRRLFGIGPGRHRRKRRVPDLWGEDQGRLSLLLALGLARTVADILKNAGDAAIAAGVATTHALKPAEDGIEFSDGMFRVVGTDRALSLKDVAEAAYVPSRLPNFPNSCHVCEVEIDPETGSTQVLRYVFVDDVGTVINPLTLAGQIHGGVAQGIGQAFTEHLVYDAGWGQLLTGSLMDYELPRADKVYSFEMDENPVQTKTNPLGVKGAGEAGNVGALAAIMNAVVDALSPLGVAHIDMPATPEKVWRAIRAAQEG